VAEAFACGEPRPAGEAPLPADFESWVAVFVSATRGTVKGGKIMTSHRKKQIRNQTKQSRATKPNVTSTALPHVPGVSPGSVDVVGILPDDVHVDPDIMEGHPGYEESGGSEQKPSKTADSGKPECRSTNETKPIALPR
jgi:hypothetical protein